MFHLLRQLCGAPVLFPSPGAGDSRSESVAPTPQTLSGVDQGDHEQSSGVKTKTGFQGFHETDVV